MPNNLEVNHLERVALGRQKQFDVAVAVVVAVDNEEMKAVVVAIPDEGYCVNCSFFQMLFYLKSERNVKRETLFIIQQSNLYVVEPKRGII